MPRLYGFDQECSLLRRRKVLGIPFPATSSAFHASLLAVFTSLCRNLDEEIDWFTDLRTDLLCEAFPVLEYWLDQLVD